MAEPDFAWKKLGDWEATTKDHDPEANSIPNDSDSESENDGQLNGTEHYLPVGSSRLRVKAALPLGPRYQGSRISRAVLEDESDASQHLDISNSEGEEETRKMSDISWARRQAGVTGSSNITSLSFRNGAPAPRPVATDFLPSEDEDAVSDSRVDAPSVANGNSEIDERNSEDSDVASTAIGESNEKAESEENMNGRGQKSVKTGRNTPRSKQQKRGRDDLNSLPLELRDAKADTSRPLVPAVARDAERGDAIRQQRTMFDGLLNMRIRLQKGLIAANSAHVMNGSRDEMDQGQSQVAEETLLKLWHSISSLRDNAPMKTGWKRKRPLDDSADIQDLWDEMQDYEMAVIRHRNKVLDKWSAKLRLTETATGDRRRIELAEKMRKPLSEVLQDRLSDPSQRLVNHSKMPRSCAPIQHSRKMTSDLHIYDDADFYQLLLKELVDQRAVEATSARTDMIESQQMNDASHAVVIREAKTHKIVDRKASRGRRMRFTVHDKLQDFMAREDRRTWEEGAIDRFFGTLFGFRLNLGDEDASEGEEDDKLPSKGEGIRLFRD